jgi:hypothetical protein
MGHEKVGSQYLYSSSTHSSAVWADALPTSSIITKGANIALRVGMPVKQGTMSLDHEFCKTHAQTRHYPSSSPFNLLLQIMN